MSENAKTITFVVVGLVAVALGLVSAPTSAELDEASLVGVNLTKTFDSPDKAKRLRIVRVDEDTAVRHEFEVAEQNGIWSIPSKDGYPADAARQMAEAATSLMGRKVLHVASENAGDHEEYGVIDPQSEKLEPGQKGVGTRVTMWDEQNIALADLIVGKPVRDAEGQRYVRKAGQDVVYIIEIDPSKLSTNFEDWIEKDLLKLQSWDLQQVQIKDYSAELVPIVTQDGRLSIQLTMDPRAEMTFNYNDTDAKWAAAKLREFQRKTGDSGEENGQYVDFKLGPDEELNEEALNGLKTALGDLKIVDVVRKPQGLSNDLKAGQDFMNNNDAKKDLMSKGFTVAPGEGGSKEIVSSEGEVIATTKNGTQYVLRFGNLTNVARDGQDKGENTSAKNTKEDTKADKADKNDVHRYLFVMARFDESAVKRPETQPLPDLPAKAEAKKDEAAAATKKKDDASPNADKKSADAPADKSDAGKSGDGKDQPPADSKKDDSAKKDDATTKKEDEAAKKDDPSAKKDDPAKKNDNAAAKNATEHDKEVEKVIAERKRIQQENQRKEDEYQAQLKKGQENVKNLNLRFGDWYFVVGDDVFHKIRLGRDKVVKKKEKPKAEVSGDKKDAAAPAGGIPGLPPIPADKK